MADIIYILQNPAFPEDLIKVGYTSRDLNSRINALSKPAGVPARFRCVYACTVEDGRDIEKYIFDVFADNRKNPKREFLWINPERIIKLLEKVKIADVVLDSGTAEDEADPEMAKRVKARRSNFRFSDVDIPTGSTLHYIRDANKTCIVHDDRRVKFRGELMYLSRAAQILLEEDGVKWATYGGPHHWVYGNDESVSESLSERRIRMENEAANDRDGIS